MHFINHRVNTLAQLSETTLGNGMELDLRADSRLRGDLLIHHDAWAQGVNFEDWLMEYKKLGHTGTLIFNTKEDGLEQRICELADKYSVSNYFFLDTAFPTLVYWTHHKGRNFFAGRASSYEDWRQYLTFKVRPQWLWMDCFDGTPLNPDIFEEAAQYFKLCLVSPELQGKPIKSARGFLIQANYCSAICTKNTLFWENLLQ